MKSPMLAEKWSITSGGLGLSNDVGLGSSWAPGAGLSTELFREHQRQGQGELPVVADLS